MVAIAMQWSVVDVTAGNMLYERCKGTFHVLAFFSGFFEIANCKIFVTELQDLDSRF
jgi:hypothetical protein